ncbi:hypothetical protein PoB_002673100 [Plakobranchus ocellatus]|uniref:Uncharacterized protein n=1 Tax=Plakobranchus ocellatus TaxID=259542 RepID=A0AAV4A0F0_9GAST|nr:hypothetical protein PoB_002673100 [Plakobranchus ocellatus]
MEGHLDSCTDEKLIHVHRERGGLRVEGRIITATKPGIGPNTDATPEATTLLDWSLQTQWMLLRLKRQDWQGYVIHGDDDDDDDDDEEEEEEEEEGGGGGGRKEWQGGGGGGREGWQRGGGGERKGGERRDSAMKGTLDEATT